LLTYSDDVNLHAKFQAWENYDAYDQPHLSLDGKTPCEVIKSLLKREQSVSQGMTKNNLIVGHTIA
jgi:hypothetical protein